MSMERELTRHLTECAKRFADARNMTTRQVAALVLNDRGFFERIEGGASFTARTYDRAMQVFDQNWPDGVSWPLGVPRPTARSAS